MPTKTQVGLVIPNALFNALFEARITDPEKAATVIAANLKGIRNLSANPHFNQCPEVGDIVTLWSAMQMLVTRMRIITDNEDETLQHSSELIDAIKNTVMESVFEMEPSHSNSDAGIRMEVRNKDGSVKAKKDGNHPN